jgi:hypothetical protein
MRALTLSVIVLGLGTVMLVAALRTCKGAIGEEASLSRNNDGTGDKSSMREMCGPNPALPDMIAKLDVVEAVIRGELALVEAAWIFRDLSASDPGFIDRMRRVYPSVARDEELYALNVIRHVSAALSKKKVDSTTVVERLKVELRRHVEAGTLRFPA